MGRGGKLCWVRTPQWLGGVRVPPGPRCSWRGVSSRGVMTPAGVWPVVKAGYSFHPLATTLSSPPASCIPMPVGQWGVVASLTFKPTLAFWGGAGASFLYDVSLPSFPSLGTGWWHLPGTLLLGTAWRHVCRHRWQQPRSRHHRQPGSGERGQPCPKAGSGVHIPPPPPILLLIFNFISQSRA